MCVVRAHIIRLITSIFMPCNLLPYKKLSFPYIFMKMSHLFVGLSVTNVSMTILCWHKISFLHLLCCFSIFFFFVYSLTAKNERKLCVICVNYNVDRFTTFINLVPVKRNLMKSIEFTILCIRQFKIGFYALKSTPFRHIIFTITSPDH